MDGPSAAVLVAVRRRAIRLEQGMDTNSCVHHMLDKAGLSPNAACQSMGEQTAVMDQSLSAGRHRRTDAGENNLACGYELQLVGRGETLRIDPAPASEAENTQKTPRKGSFPLFGNQRHRMRSEMARSSWQVRAIPVPHVLHVRATRTVWRPLRQPRLCTRKKESLEAQLARVRKMRRLQPGDKGRGEVIDSCFTTSTTGPPRQKQRPRSAGRGTRPRAVRILAEARTQKYKKPERPPVERKPSKKGPKFFTGLFITFGGDK